jgi:hypothetical protein
MSLLTGQGGSTGVPTSRFTAIRGYLDRALQKIWEAEHWPELNRTQERKYRLEWDSTTTYSASTSSAAVEVYFTPSGKYYQSIVASNLNNAPASGATWVENSSKWAESKTAYTGGDWAASTVYTVGTIVRRATGTTADFRYYQCTTAHTSGASFDTTKFGILTDFDAYVAYTQTGQTAIGEVFNVTDSNPRTTRAFSEYPFMLSENGVQVPNGPSVVWLEFRTRRSQLVGDTYSATTAYAVGQQIYYTTSLGVGNFYDCIVTTTAGQSPATTPASWSVVQIPYIFSQHLIWAAYADLLGSDGQADKATVAMNAAEQYYGMEADKLYRQQRQTQPLRVVGY